MSARAALPVLLLASWLLATRASAMAQVEEMPQGGVGVLETRERLEQIEQEKRNRERQRELTHPKSSDCRATGTCALWEQGIRSQPIPGTGLIAVLHDVDVEKESLTIRLRFINRSSQPASIALDPNGSYDAYFVEVDEEKRHILRSDDGALAAKKPLARRLRPGAMESWWARFPPLPAGATSFDVMIPPAPRFEGISVHDD